MKKSLIIILVIISGIIALVAIAGIYKFNFTNDDVYIQTGGELNPTMETNTPVQMANPASTNCSKQGGNLVIQKRGDGGEYGLCYFDDNRACEEWAMMRGDCPIGGVKTTGFDTIDQKYCAWLGGKTLAVPQSICTLKDGSECSTEEFYNGKCPAAK